MNCHYPNLACPNIRKLLESAYDQNRLNDAVEIGNIMDEMQCLLFISEQEDAAC